MGKKTTRQVEAFTTVVLSTSYFFFFRFAFILLKTKTNGDDNDYNNLQYSIAEA